MHSSTESTKKSSAFSSDHTVVIKEMGKALNKKEYKVIIEKITPLLSTLVGEIESVPIQECSNTQAYQNLTHLLHFYSLLEEAYKGLGDNENARLYQLKCQLVVDTFKSAPLISEPKEKKVEVLWASDSEQKEVENVFSLVKKAHELINRNEYKEAFPLLMKLKPYVINYQSKDEIFDKVFCLNAINTCFYESKGIHKNRKEIIENFKELLKFIVEHPAELINKLKVPGYFEMAHQFYTIHTKIFLAYYCLSSSSMSQATDALKYFVFCGIRGIQINKKDRESLREPYVNLLNAYVSKNYGLPALSISMGAEELKEWEKNCNKIIDSITAELEYLYTKAEQIILDEGAYTKEAGKYLIKALNKHLSDCSDKAFKFNPIKANILLARCYTENKTPGGAKKHQAVINQMIDLQTHDLPGMPEIPKLWSLRLEYGLALLTEDNNMTGAIREFELALLSKDYFDPDKDFFKINSITILQLIAEYLMEYTQKKPQPDFKAIEPFFNIVIKLNERKPKDESVYARIAEAYANLGKLTESKRYLEEVCNVELRGNIIQKQQKIAVTAEKEIIEKKPEVLTKAPAAAKKAPKKSKVEEVQDSDVEIERSKKRREKELQEKAKRKEKLALKKAEQRQRLEEEEKERERSRREAYKQRTLGKPKKKHNKPEVEDAPPLSEKSLRKKQHTKDKNKVKEEKVVCEERIIALQQAKIAEEEAVRIKKKQASQEKKQNHSEMKKLVKTLFTVVPSIEKSIDPQVLKETQAKGKAIGLKKIKKENEKKAAAEELLRQAEEKRKAEEEIIQRKEQEKSALAKQIKQEKKEDKNVIKQVHAGLIDVALALNNKQDPHKAINDNEILKQLKTLNDELKANPLLSHLELIIQGSAVLEFYLTKKTGDKINFDVNDLDLFIYHAPKKHIACSDQPLTKEQEKENKAHDALKAILKKNGFYQLMRDKDKKGSRPFANYTHENNKKLQLTVADKDYQSNDPFYFTRGKIRFSDLHGLELLNPEVFDSAEKMTLECDLITANSLHTVNFFVRLLKYYEKGIKNKFTFGENFKKALKDHDWQFNFFLTKFMQAEFVDEKHSNYLEMKSVITSICSDQSKISSETLVATKDLLHSFCLAVYFNRYRVKQDNGACSLMSDLLMTYYANKGSNSAAFYSDLNFMIENKDALLHQPFLYTTLKNYYASNDAHPKSLISDLKFLMTKEITLSSIEFYQSELVRSNTPLKIISSFPQKHPSLLVCTSMFSPAATTDSGGTLTSPFSGVISPQLSYSRHSDSE